MRSTRIARLAAIAATAALIPSLGVSAAQAAQSPNAVGTGATYLETFASGLSGWTAVMGTTNDWQSADGVISADTRSWTSGRYIRPSGPLSLPDAYELTANVRIDEVASGGTVTLMLDMLQPDSLKASGISPQFTGFDGDGHSRVQVAKPIASGTICKGLSPVEQGEWFQLKVKRAGGVTAVYTDNRLVAAVASPTAGGTFGFGSYKSKVSFGAVSIDPLASVPSNHPAVAGCPWTEPSGPGEVSGEGRWVEAVASATDRPGHEVTSGQATISLDGDWAFKHEEPARTTCDTPTKVDGEALKWNEPATDASSWGTLRVPGTWAVHDAYGETKGNGWYRRTFESGDLSAAAGERAWLRFGAVYNSATVWLNGHELGEHVGGYTPFEFEVTDLLVDGENTVVVRANNCFEQGAWWPWGGISRSVDLVKTGEVVIDRQQIVATPDLGARTAHVESTVYLQSTAADARTVTLSGTITDAETGATIATGLQAQVQVPADGKAQVVLSADLPADSFELWNLNDPELYRVNVTMDSPADADDASQSDRFGIREFKIDGTKVLLNNQALKLAGANRVSEDPINGNVEPLAVVRRDLDRMKASGLNLSRIMHYAQAPELLDYADEIGMILIDEVPVWGKARQDAMKDPEIKQIKQEFREMVERDFNHPSIFAHSVANEIESQYDYGQTYVEAMVDYSESIDPARFVTFASNKVQGKADGTTDTATEEASQHVDFVSVNLYTGYAGMAEQVKDINGTYPDKPLYISEYSPDSFTFGVERETLDWKVGSVDVTSIFESRAYVFGWSQWSYNDYRSKYSGTSPNSVRGWGQQDVWGRLKAGFATTQADNAPVAGLTIGSAAAGPDGGAGLVTVTPRGSNLVAGPAYTLSGYRVSVQASAPDGSIVGGTIMDLPELAPGTAPVTLPVTWDATEQASRLRVTLLSPTGFEEAVTTTELAQAAAPEIIDAITADGAVRVRFSDPAGVGQYTVTASDAAGNDVAVDTTGESFADLRGLTNGTEYTIRVSALGSTLEDTVTATPGGADRMAPQLFALTPIDDGLVLGFSQDSRTTEDLPVTFEVRVVNASTGVVAQTYTTSNRPGTRIENLDPGTAYRVSIREVTLGKTSVWSEELTATPRSAPELRVRGTIAGASSAAVVISPSDDTVRYRVSVTGPGVERTVDVERSWVNLLPIDGLAADSTYDVSVAAVGSGGTSEAWHGSVTTAPAPDGQVAVKPTGLTVTGTGADARLTWTGPGADAFIVARTACGVTTNTLITTAELLVGWNGGQYTVTAVRGATLSAASSAITAPGTAQCGTVVTTGQTTARPDGSKPFSITGTWSSSSLTAPGGHGSRYSEVKPVKTPPPTEPVVSATATWTLPVAASPARYRIEVALPASATSSSQVRYTIQAGTSTARRAVDQAGSGGRWVSLGEHEVAAGEQLSVKLSDGTPGYMRASAVRFVPVG